MTDFNDPFDEAEYLRLNPDVAMAIRAGVFASGWEHWQARGRSEGRFTFLPHDVNFDELAYLTQNPDIEAAVLRGEVRSGYEHWFRRGEAERRTTAVSADVPRHWNEGRYLRLNPDVAIALRNGTFSSGHDHWLRYGQYELRPGGRAAYSTTSMVKALRNAPAGFNSFGFYDAAIGLGSAARSYAGALRQVLPLAEISIPWDLERISAATPEAPPYGINLIHLNPDVLPLFLRHYGPSVIPSRYNIGIWVWELHAAYPSWRGLSSAFNEIWTPSTFSAAAIRAVSRAPVFVIPHVVDELPGPASDDRSQFGWGDDVFVFLYIFDLASALDRKNPLALLRAFRKAFGPRQDVRLVFKYHNPRFDEPGAALLERLMTEAPNTQIMAETFSEERLYALLRGCDCFVSPHRAEGFGLNIAAAMYYRKPVVVTAYSGNLDFTTDENSYLIDYELAPVYRESGCYKANYGWADVSEDHLADLLLRVVEAPDEARRKAENGRLTIRERFSVQAVAETIRQRHTAWGV